MVVHLFSHPVDCEALRALADRQQLLLFEDASQAHGAKFNGRRVGDWVMALPLVQGMKLLQAEGGYAVFRDDEAQIRLPVRQAPAWTARRTSPAPNRCRPVDALQLGWRPCAVGAELLRGQLPYLEEEVALATVTHTSAKRLPHAQPLSVRRKFQVPKAAITCSAS